MNDKTKVSEQLTQEFWDERWTNHQTGWDIGAASTPIAEFFKDWADKKTRILIPGCGNAHEAELLLEEGFQDITLLDFAPAAVEILQKKFSGNPHIQIIATDFFEHQGMYDLIIEQTFFCAITPDFREKYVEKCHELLSDQGKIVGVLFNTKFDKTGPPFGGDLEEYERLFQPFFNIEILEPCYNSIPPRKNLEVFISLSKNINHKK